MKILPDHTRIVRATESSWQQHLKLAIRCPQQLAKRLDLPLDSLCPTQSTGSFPLFVPLPFLNRIRLGDPRDPLLQQVLPSPRENDRHPDYLQDPVGESGFQAAAGLLHKYAGRALIVMTGTCAIHCRYCFRRHFPYENSNTLADGWQAAVEYLGNDLSIHEVILSGGDPLTVVDAKLETLINSLESLPHVKRLRIHTRLPIVIPQRITPRLVALLASSRLTAVVVVHVNHPNEIDAEVAAAIGQLTRSSMLVLNQSVLLKGVNDDPVALVELSERLVEIGVLPYYLHQLDPVAGAAHFEVPVARGLELMQHLRRTLPGYMVPRYVREIPGELSKTILA